MKVEIKFKTFPNKTIYCWIATEKDCIGRGNTKRQAIQELEEAKQEAIK